MTIILGPLTIHFGSFGFLMHLSWPKFWIAYFCCSLVSMCWIAWLRGRAFAHPDMQKALEYYRDCYGCSLPSLSDGQGTCSQDHKHRMAWRALPGVLNPWIYLCGVLGPFAVLGLLVNLVQRIGYYFGRRRWIPVEIGEKLTS